MVAHHVLYVLHAQGLFGLHTKGHGGGTAFAHSITQIGLHVFGCPTVEEAPHTGFTETLRSEIGGRISGLERELLILTVEIALFASKGNDILAVDAIFLVLERELADTALVGVRRDAIVRNADSHPYGTLAARTLANHFKNPHLIGVGNGETLTVGTISVLFHQLAHYLDGLARIAGTLQGNVHQASVIEQTGGVFQFFPTPKCGFVNGKLELVHQSDDTVGLLCLGYFAQVVV